MKNLYKFIKESIDSKIEQEFINALSEAAKWASGIHYGPSTGDKEYKGPENPNHIEVNILIGASGIKKHEMNKIIQRCAGQIIEGWIIENMPDELKDSEGNSWSKTIPDYSTHYDFVYYNEENKKNNINIEVKSYKDGQIKNVKYSSNNQKDDVDLYIFVDYSIKDNVIKFNSIKLSWKGDTLSEIKTKNIPAKVIKNGKDAITLSLSEKK